ncbi:MAG TPA: hypothetical protein VMQ45_11710 [Burkholderiaceae bacterium]|jgi:hypothetical protein|nr:hypothetical protein [Burkholderiaceae bacterium]
MGVRHVLIAIMCIVVSLTGCRTMRPVDLAGKEPLIAKVGPNDFVRVWMRDGRTLDLQLTAVEPDALVSGAQRLPLADIERVERRDISWTRTTLLLVAIAVVTYIAAAAAAVHSVSACC